MGKGDKKTKRGKIIAGSYGVRRPRKIRKYSKPVVADKTEEPVAVKKPAAKKTTKPSAKKTSPKAKTESKTSSKAKAATTKKNTKKEVEKAKDL